MGKVMGMGEKMPELEVLRDKAIGAPPQDPSPPSSWTGLHTTCWLNSISCRVLGSKAYVRKDEKGGLTGPARASGF